MDLMIFKPIFNSFKSFGATMERRTAAGTGVFPTAKRSPQYTWTPAFLAQVSKILPFQPSGLVQGYSFLMWDPLFI